LTSESIDGLFARFGPSYRWLVTIAGITGTFAMILSATVVNVAVPKVMGAYGIGQDQAQWMATAFIATMTVSQLVSTWMVAKLGPRPTFILIQTIFISASFLGALSPSFDFIIVARIVQGFCAGVIQPLVMVTVFSVFPAERRVLAMGVFGMGIVLAPGMGPWIGGIAIDTFSWRHIFFMPLPLSVVSLLMGAVFMPAGDPNRKKPKLDWAGVLLLGAALFLILSALANGQRYGWHSEAILVMFSVGLASAVAFILLQSRSKAPLLNLSLFNNPQFASAAVVALVFGAGNFATQYVVPVFAQTIQGYTPTDAGLLIIPAGITLVVVIFVTSRLFATFPGHIPVIVGLVLFAASAVLLTGADVNSGYWTIAIYMVIGRAGLGFIMPFLNTTALKALPPEQLNQGAGTVNFFRQMGGAFGINGLVVVLETRTQFHGTAMAATQTPSNSATQEFLDRVMRIYQESGLPESLHMPGALDFLDKVLYAQASTWAFQDGFVFLTAIFILSLIPAWILGRSYRVEARGV